jgi:pseudouridine-5'-phosphate glycosidase
VTVSAEILKAVRNGDPVVALESTIITHGMPYPKNFDMSIKVERILRDKVLFKQYF